MSMVSIVTKLIMHPVGFAPTVKMFIWDCPNVNSTLIFKSNIPLIKSFKLFVPLSIEVIFTFSARMNGHSHSSRHPSLAQEDELLVGLNYL